MPRVLFPNKVDTDSDSEVTAKYSGASLTVREGTSISIGYLGELYIDFGVAGALAACGLGGVLFGRAYRFLRGSGGPLLLRFGLCAVFAYSISIFGIALVKGLGGAVTTFVAAVLLQRYVFPRLIVLVRLYGAPARRIGRASEQLA